LVFVQWAFFLPSPYSAPPPPRTLTSVNDYNTQRESHLRYTAGSSLRRIQHSGMVSALPALLTVRSADLGYAST
jgi:hypothetical protein